MHQRRGSTKPTTITSLISIVLVLLIFAVGTVTAIGDGGDDDSKICVIHAGPHKTGSTSLQQFIIMTPSVDEAFKKDNYEVPNFPYDYGKFGPIMTKNHALIVNCLRPETAKINSCQTETSRKFTFNYFQEFVNDAERNGSNIVLSNEAFDQPDMNITKLTSFLEPQYKTHVVVYYRRFYDWLHSLYNQIQKTKPRNRPRVPFVEWLTNDNLQKHLPKYSLAVYERYKAAPGVYNVSVVNMHEDPDNFNSNERFACHHLDQAPHTCEVAKSLEAYHSNPSVNLDWTIFRAKIPLYHSIDLSKNDERWEKIEAKFVLITDDAPRICLSPEWKSKLLEISLEAEKALTPESWYNGKEGLENLKADFEEKIKSKFCYLDIATILTSVEWQTFLTELDKEGTKEGS